jgi:hypothetical protein
MGYLQSPGVFLFIQKTATFGINNQVNKNLGKPVELKIQDTILIKYILLSAYGESSSM